ncbi:MAG: hypothetical protein IPM85_05200 [Chitinophagaceae bacterium]|nr:hypothetical protein [Chitinophagaceae bacterium]
MKVKFISFITVALLQLQTATAQDRCGSHSYLQTELQRKPSLSARISEAEKNSRETMARVFTGIVKIPVVIHNLYHTPEEKITDAQAMSQIDAFNKHFRKRNADTAAILPISVPCLPIVKLNFNSPFLIRVKDLHPG